MIAMEMCDLLSENTESLACRFSCVSPLTITIIDSRCISSST